MNTIKLSNTFITIPIVKKTKVTVKIIQRNGFENKVQFIDYITGTILKSFVCYISETQDFIRVYANQYNFIIN